MVDGVHRSTRLSLRGSSTPAPVKHAGSGERPIIDVGAVRHRFAKMLLCTAMAFKSCTYQRIKVTPKS
uniref:Uncharacterized protein n=1 Tax=mine drainage metagenome TaxID=410659 RepID=E6PPN0_9ZZZZ